VPIKEEAKSQQYLKQGKIISFATDTVYALACDAYNYEAIERIYQIKNRDRSKFLGVLISDFLALEKICYISNQEKEFLKNFYNQGLTLILDKKLKFPKYIGDEKSIAVRLANTEFSQNLAKNFDGTVAMTSLNIAGEKEITSFAEAWSNFSSKIDLIINDGVCKFQEPSTIIRFIDGKMRVLRQGVFKISSYLNQN
jgi:L-threonylcarbamoyladenylate synthase